MNPNNIGLFSKLQIETAFGSTILDLFARIGATDKEYILKEADTAWERMASGLEELARNKCIEDELLNLLERKQCNVVSIELPQPSCTSLPLIWDEYEDGACVPTVEDCGREPLTVRYLAEYYKELAMDNAMSNDKKGIK